MIGILFPETVMKTTAQRGWRAIAQDLFLPVSSAADCLCFVFLAADMLLLGHGEHSLISKVDLKQHG